MHPDAAVTATFESDDRFPARHRRKFPERECPCWTGVPAAQRQPEFLWYEIRDVPVVQNEEIIVWHHVARDAAEVGETRPGAGGKGFEVGPRRGVARLARAA